MIGTPSNLCSIEVSAMEVKTSEQLQLKKIDDFDRQFHSSLWLKRKWVAVSDVLEWIDNLRKSNDMWRYAVDECFGMLEDSLTSTYLCPEDKRLLQKAEKLYELKESELVREIVHSWLFNNKLLLEEKKN